MICCQASNIVAKLVKAGHDDLADRFIDVLEASQAEPGDLEDEMDDDEASAAWGKLPEGWTEQSLKKFWASLVGKDIKHKITKCMQKMDGKVDNPGAFCGSLAKKVGYER